MYEIGTHVDLTYLNLTTNTTPEPEPEHREYEVGTRYLFVSFKPSFSRLQLS
jgi:hypothetical protein